MIMYRILSLFDMVERMISDIVKARVETLEQEKIIRYADFSELDKEKQAVAKALSNLFKKGVLRRVSKGMYYKPSYSRFGELPLEDTTIINKYLEVSKKNISYLSGMTIYRGWGLTTQVSKEYLIMNDTRTGSIDINNMTIRFVKTPVSEKINDKDIKLLQILDAFSDIKVIPDCTTTFACKRLTSLIDVLPDENKEKLVDLSRYYQPMVRAVLGCILEKLNKIKLSSSLKNTLNPLTSFSLGISEEFLPNKAKWKIV